MTLWHSYCKVSSLEPFVGLVHASLKTETIHTSSNASVKTAQQVLVSALQLFGSIVGSRTTHYSPQWDSPSVTPGHTWNAFVVGGEAGTAAARLYYNLFSL